MTSSPPAIPPIEIPPFTEILSQLIVRRPLSLFFFFFPFFLVNGTRNKTKKSAAAAAAVRCPPAISGVAFFFSSAGMPSCCSQKKFLLLLLHFGISPSVGSGPECLISFSLSGNFFARFFVKKRAAG